MATWKDTDGFTDAQVAVLNNLSDSRYNNDIYNWSNGYFQSTLVDTDVENLRAMVNITNYQLVSVNPSVLQSTLNVTYDSASDYTDQEKSWIAGWKFNNAGKIGFAIARAKRLLALSYADQTIIDLLGESL
tara:strand:+ start:2153 stop:2545 length:393 start_codon:yes stop_codon:yes gene_type:complete